MLYFIGLNKEHIGFLFLKQCTLIDFLFICVA